MRNNSDKPNAAEGRSALNRREFIGAAGGAALAEQGEGRIANVVPGR